MSKALKVLALVLAALLALSVFAGCKEQETQGSSSVSTESEYAGDIGDNESDVTSDEESEAANTESKDKDKNPSSKKENADKDTSSTKSKKPSKNDKKEIKVNKTGWPIVDEKVTFKIAGIALVDTKDYKKMSMFKYYEPLTNINIEFDAGTEGTAIEKKTLALKSGDLPDMYALYGISYSDKELYQYAYGKKPAYVDLMPFIEEGYAPNTAALIKQYPDRAAVNKDEKGRMFFLPGRPKTVPEYEHYLNVNKEWLNNVDIEFKNGKYPTDTQEFLKMLQAFRDQDANGNGDSKDEIPFGVWYLSYSYIFQSFGIAPGEGEIAIDNNGKVFYSTTNAVAEAATKYWRNILVEEPGLVKLDTINDFAGNYAKFKDLIKSGKCGSFIYKYIDGVARAGILDQYMTIPIPTANATLDGYSLPKAIHPAPQAPGRAGVVFTTACKSVPALLRYIDYIRNTDEGIMLCNYGDPNGGLYKKKSDGSYELTEKGIKTGAQVEGIGWSMGGGGTDTLLKPLSKPGDKVAALTDAYHTEARKVYAAANKADPHYMLPTYMKTSDEIRKLQKYEGKFPGSPWIDGFARGHKDMADWTSGVNDANSKGLKQYVTLYQGIVDRNNKLIPRSDTVK